MKYCTRCGAELFDEAVVCPKCGCAIGTAEQIVASGSGVDKQFVAGLVMIILGVVGLVVSLIMMYSAEGQLRWELDDSYPKVMVGFLGVSIIVAFVGVMQLVDKNDKPILVPENFCRRETIERNRKKNKKALIIAIIIWLSSALVSVVAYFVSSKFV